MEYQIYSSFYSVLFQEKIFSPEMVLPAKQKQNKTSGFLPLDRLDWTGQVSGFGLLVCWGFPPLFFLIVEKIFLSPSWELSCWEERIWNKGNGASELLLCWLKVCRKARNEHFMEQFHLTPLLDFFVNSAQFPSAFTIFYGMDIFSLPCGAK